MAGPLGSASRRGVRVVGGGRLLAGRRSRYCAALSRLSGARGVWLPHANSGGSVLPGGRRFRPLFSHNLWNFLKKSALLVSESSRSLCVRHALKLSSTRFRHYNNKSFLI